LDIKKPCVIFSELLFVSLKLEMFLLRIKWPSKGKKKKPWGVGKMYLVEIAEQVLHQSISISPDIP
jgi:hypothetical protein